MSISLDKVGNYSNLGLTRRDRDKNFHSGGMVDDPTKKQTWADRQTLLNESWAQSHAEIFNFFLQSTFAVPDDAMCERCLNEFAVVKMPGMLGLTTFLQWL